MAMLVVATDAGAIAIKQHEISTITAAELCQLRISRVDLRRLFAEAAKLLQGIKPRDRARPVAIRALDGHWEVHTDPRNSRARSLNRPDGSIFGWAVQYVGIMRFAGPLSGFYIRSNDSKTRRAWDQCRRQFCASPKTR